MCIQFPGEVHMHWGVLSGILNVQRPPQSRIQGLQRRCGNGARKKAPRRLSENNVLANAWMASFFTRVGNHMPHIQQVHKWANVLCNNTVKRYMLPKYRPTCHTSWQRGQYTRWWWKAWDTKGTRPLSASLTSTWCGRKNTRVLSFPRYGKLSKMVIRLDLSTIIL